MTTTVRGDLRRYDSRFRELHDESLSLGSDLALVTWLGYDAPQNGEVLSPDRTVLGSSLARNNADDLAAFLSGLSAARPTRPHQTVWAHSYGSVLTGFALLQPNPVDDVVVFGSPGLPFDRIGATGLKPGGLNVIRAAGDDVALFGPAVHGTSAVTVAGSRWLSSSAQKDTPNDLAESSGHAHYLDEGSTSAHNLLAVAVSRPDLVRLAGEQERGHLPTWSRLRPTLVLAGPPS